MSFKNYKKGMKRSEDQALERTAWYTRPKYGFPWKMRKPGSWKSEEPKRHPGWAAYHANKDKE